MAPPSDRCCTDSDSVFVSGYLLLSINCSVPRVLSCKVVIHESFSLSRPLSLTDSTYSPMTGAAPQRKVEFGSRHQQQIKKRGREVNYWLGLTIGGFDSSSCVIGRRRRLRGRGLSPRQLSLEEKPLPSPPTRTTGGRFYVNLHLRDNKVESDYQEHRTD